MRILILSFYYRPDLSAGSFRTTALVAALRERVEKGTQIDVLTTLPNRYHTYAPDAPQVETAEGLEVRRIKLPAHRSDMVGQARSFLRFARQALAFTADRHYDVVFATSSRLMTAALGARIARRSRARLYLDIRDIFVDTLPEVLPPLLAWPARLTFSMVESWTMRRADRINLVSPGFEEYFRTRYGSRSFARFTNGIDDEFLAPAAPLAAAEPRDQRATVLYAGNIGEGQGLHEILPGLAAALARRARFIVIGDGGRRAALERAVAKVENVELRWPVDRAELLQSYRAADVLFLHLGARAAFEKVLPSKLFEYAALGKPVLAGVRGYAARFVEEEITNAAVFAPCDVHAAASAFDRLDLVDRPRAAFIAKFRRTSIARAMADDLIAVGSGAT